MRHILKFNQIIFSLIIGLILTTGLTQAQETDEPTWTATYWNNKTLSGDWVVRRQEANVDYNWGTDAPAPGVNRDEFSVRWERTITFEAATYRFTASSDDGIRVWIDGEKIIDEWFDHALKTVSVDLPLAAGSHRIRVEYYEDGGGAVVQLRWRPVSTGGQSWRGEYFNNRNLEGEPRLVRNDAQINFNWGTDSPAPGQIGTDNFSVRWTQTRDFPAGLYRFTMTVDDGGRLWVNDKLIIDAWREKSPTEYEADIDLSGGPVAMRMEYFEKSNGALAQLDWELVTAINDKWQAEYFNNRDLSGEPVLTREDPHINFNWRQSSPAPDLLGVDRFSARWQRTVRIPAGLYCFVMTVDDGGRMWLNGRPFIGGWKVQSLETYSQKIRLPAGLISMRMEYFENTGNAGAQLIWVKVDPPALQDIQYLNDDDVGFIPDNPTIKQNVLEICRRLPILTR